jgi:hypothetical protein
MICEQCQQNFELKKSGFLVCPHCGYVNHQVDSQRHVAPVSTSPVKFSALKRLLALPKPTLYASVAGVVLFAGLLSGTVYQNGHAAHQHARAVNLDIAGSYAAAEEVLKNTSTILVLPHTSHNVAAEKSRNTLWLNYASDQAEAKQLASAQKYAEALSLLNGISHEFPTYRSVTSDIKQISEQQLAAQNEAKKLADTKIAEAAKDTKKPSAPKKVTVVTPASGKRFTRRCKLFLASTVSLCKLPM